MDAIQSDTAFKQAVEHKEWWSTGVLHDFNNLLAIILSHSSIALTKLPTDHPAHHYVERVVRATKRAADISGQLLVDMTRQWEAPLPIDLNRVVQDTADLLEARLTAKHELRLELKPNIKPLLANITQIQQVVMNLMLNAIEAIEQPSGRVTISTGNLVVFIPGIGFDAELIGSRVGDRSKQVLEIKSMIDKVAS